MKSRNLSIPLAALGATVMLASCGSSSGSGSASASAEATATARDQLTPAEFNRLAVRRNLPLYWMGGANGSKSVEDSEVARLLFYPGSPPDLATAYSELLSAKTEPALDQTTAEGKRRTLVREDLDQGRPTLVRTDLTQLSPAEKTFVQHMLQVAARTDDLYSTITGAAAMASQVAPDPESRSLFRRNWGPKCVAPATEKNPDCSAIPGAPRPVVDVWPTAAGNLKQGDADFCSTLEKRSDLVSPFTAVREVNGKLAAVPYSEAYSAQMAAIATELRAAADALGGVNEEPLVDYLRAAAASYTSNDWWPADEAWARMNADNSRWYVRAAPDETYWEPCSIKAGFHLTLALINQGAKLWQGKLVSIQQEMEAAIAQRAGAPYQPRQVKFHLPDFIDVVINAGDDRAPLSGVAGESLPNFGPVAKESRGRTVAMVNLFNDPDSIASRRTSASTLLDKESLADFSDESLPVQLTTVLHEATHNLGPAQEYAVGGTPVQKIFGGPVDSLLEELKAETGAYFLIDMLRGKAMISDALARQMYVNNVVWGLGQTSKGMYTSSHKRQTYPELAAIQLGFLTDAGALTWDANALAANGQDKGAYTIHLDKIVAASESMMQTVAGIKARGDKKAMDELLRKYVDGSVVPHAAIEERWAREPRVSLVYSPSM